MIPAVEDLLPIPGPHGAQAAPEATNYLLDSLVLARRVNVAETADAETADVDTRQSSDLGLVIPL